MIKKYLQIGFLCGISSLPLSAALNFMPGVTAGTYHTHSTSDNVISFDWSGSELFTMTSGGFPDINVWRHSGSGSTNIYSNANHFAGASLVAIGNYIYFNDSDFSNNQYIRKYGPLSGTATTVQASTTHNYGLYGYQGELYITGSVGWGTNEIFHSALNPDGTLLSDPAVSLGVTSGASGPIAFDGNGNLFYAPGFSDQSIYRWTSAEVAAALADPVGSPLSIGDALWYDFSATHGSYAGATGMVVGPDGNLIVSFTDFANPSILVEFQLDPLSSQYAGYYDIMTSTDRLGDVRSYNGSIFVAAGNSIIEISAVPEPATYALFVGFIGLLLCGLSHRRRNGSANAPA
jgi:hypothetical protein